LRRLDVAIDQCQHRIRGCEPFAVETICGKATMQLGFEIARDPSQANQFNRRRIAQASQAILEVPRFPDFDRAAGGWRG
jgi:hypothetical protein